MSEVKFSLPEFCERYEYVRRSTDQPIQEPGGNGSQRKNNYIFTLDDRTAIYDWSKAYFEVGFRVERAEALGAGGPANSQGKFHYNPTETAVSMINGVHSLIRRLTLQGPNGQVLYDCPEVNKALFLKKLLEWGPDFSETSASNELWYYDESPLATNIGARQRNALITTAYAVNSTAPVLRARLPLNSYSFFDSLDFNNVLLSNMSLKLIVDFETDNNLIFKDAGFNGTGRVVITKFDLWVPQLTLHASAAEKYIRSLDTPLRWSYMRERVERSSVFTLSSGRFRISGVNKPKKAFFYFITTDRDENQDANMYRYDSLFVNTASFKNGNLALVNPAVAANAVTNPAVTEGTDNVGNLGVGRTSILQRARLEFDDGSFYPHVEYGNEDIQRLYHDVLEYSHRNDNLCCGSILSRDKYKTLNSLLYFDLEYQKRSVVSDSKDMTLVFSLDPQPNAVGFIIYAILLYENDASFGRIDNSYVLLSEISK
jgi:hypothetical protein